MSHSSKIVALGFSEPLAMKALRETNWTTPTAAINWILEHPGETDVEFARLVRQVSGGDDDSDVGDDDDTHNSSIDRSTDEGGPNDGAGRVDSTQEGDAYSATVMPS